MQRLENLEITKVAFVPAGDNKRADVLLFKSKPGETDADPKDPPTVTVTEKEAGVMKRVLLALGKAFGFSEGDSAEPPAGAPDAEGMQKDAGSEQPTDGTEAATEPTQKGVDEHEMKIDKSKLTPEELAQLEAIEKKAGIQEEPNTEGEVNKGANDDGTQNTEPASEDIYKDLHPKVAAELKALRKRADEAEERELAEVAKKYELIGKKPEELVETLKSLKKAGGSAYNDMISVLDGALALAEESGAFTEIGKSGSGQPDAWAQIEKHASEILKAAPNMTRAQAIEKACDQHPELVAEYEQNK